jgi:Cu-Zn family superoxide dismutase
MLQNKWLLSLVAVFCCLNQAAFADSKVDVGMVAQVGLGKSLGSVIFSQTRYGLLVTPNLTNLSPGLHGIHIHQTPSCDNFGQAAQGHLDPKNTAKHLGPYTDKGHLGDLPALFVDSKGNANLPVLAPRLTLNDVMGHSFMIHAGGDNYSDEPKMGGGGDRIACGIIPIQAPSEQPSQNQNIASTVTSTANNQPAASAIISKPTQVVPLAPVPANLPVEQTQPATPITQQLPAETENLSTSSDNQNKFVELSLPPEQEAAIQ